MLSRLFCSSLNIGRFARIRPIKHTAISRFRALPERYYATEATKQNVPKSTSLEFIIKDLKERVENKSRLSNSDLQSILMKLKTRKCDSEQALEILRCCSFARLDENLTNIVTNIWNELKKQDNDFQTKHYNLLMNYLKERGEAKHVQNLFDEMIENKVQPDAISYQCLLAAYCKIGEMDRAIEVLGLMDKANLYINESSFNNLVQCHIICGNLDGAYETIENLKEAGYKVNFYTLEMLLIHYAKSGDLENIETTFKLFNEQNSEILNRDVLKVMCEMAANGHAEKIDKLFAYIKPTIELRRSLQNAITQFVERNQSPIVPKVLQLADGNIKGKVKYLIQEMVRCSTPEQEFNETIANIESMSITIENSFDCFKPALEGSSEEVIRKLFDHMKSHSIELSESVFEKLIDLAAKKGSTEVLNVVEMMCTDFNVQPQISFVRDHILPALNSKENPAVAFAHLLTTKIRPRVITMAMIANSLNNGDIQTAYEFANNKQTFYGVEIIRRPLLSAFKTTNDVQKFVSFVRLINDSFALINNYARQDKPLTKDEIAVKQKAFVSETLALAISNRRDDTQLILQLLKSFVDEGLSITMETAASIQRSLQVDENTEIGRLLKKLSKEPLKLRPIEVQRSTPNVMNKLSSVDVQNILEVKQAQGHNSHATEKLLFLAYIREGNLAEIESLLASGKITLSNSDYAQLIELYTRLSKLENAMNMLKRVCANNASFKLDCIKVAKLVTLMVEKGRDFSEIEEVLLKHRQGKPEFRIFVFEHLLDRLAINGNVKLVEQLFDALLEYSYVDATPESAGPLIMAHIKNGTFVEAVDKFDYLSKTFKLVPMAMILFVELIKKKEMDLLQRAYDIFEERHNTEAALARLAFAFVECGQERQARAILENENTKNLSRYISRECKQYVTYGRLEAAKTLLDATKGLYCDRRIIYQAILDIYEKKNQADEALKLWHEYSNDEGILPQQQFKTKLSKLLKANNVEIPPKLQIKQHNTDANSSKENSSQEIAGH